jgi:hypothetical protein
MNFGNVYQIEFEPSATGFQVVPYQNPPIKVCALSVADAIARSAPLCNGWNIASIALMMKDVNY